MAIQQINKLTTMDDASADALGDTRTIALTAVHALQRRVDRLRSLIHGQEQQQVERRQQQKKPDDRTESAKTMPRLDQLLAEISLQTTSSGADCAQACVDVAYAVNALVHGMQRQLVVI